MKILNIYQVILLDVDWVFAENQLKSYECPTNYPNYLKKFLEVLVRIFSISM